MTENVDVLVVGGGAAGLSGAVALARFRRTVLVVDDGTPRNAPAEGVHNLLGREGVAPSELLERGRAELAGYGGRVRAATAVRADRSDDDRGLAFDVILADGEVVHARRLLVTTGLVDELPDVPGLAEQWGRGVLHCPYCHGWEVRDQAVGVLATGPTGEHHALLFSQLTDRVTLITHGIPAPSGEFADQLAAVGVTVVEGPVAEVTSEHGVLRGVRLGSGETVSLDALVVAPFFRARSALLESLGLPIAELRMGPGAPVMGTRVEADPAGATAVPGVWVAGNVTDPMAQVGASTAAGLTAGARLNAELIESDARRLAAAR